MDNDSVVVTVTPTPIVREALENIGGSVRLFMEEDFALVRGYEVAGDPDVLKSVHEQNAALKAATKARFLKRYAP